MFTCQKTYHDIPFAHRQHHHDGHCALIHGHNWSFIFTFACREPDANGFVVDFGKLRYIKAWLDEHLDHACVFNHDDPEVKALLASSAALFKAYFVESCSSEGLAKHVHDVLNPRVLEETGGRAWIRSVEVEEDRKNTATYHAPDPAPPA